MKFNVDSFGSMCPENWEEIADYLNNCLADLCSEGADQDYAAEILWEKYCNGMLPDAPEAII